MKAEYQKYGNTREKISSKKEENICKNYVYIRDMGTNSTFA
jgi:hypothetical protein